MNKIVIITLVGLAVIVGAYRLFEQPAKAKSPYARMAVESPLETVHAPKSAPPPVANRPALKVDKVAELHQQQQDRFTDLKEEGRRIRETILASDPNAAKAFQALGQRPDYREVIDQRHKIEAAWATAPDSERNAMLEQMNTLRQQGIAILMAEIQRVNSQTGGDTLQRTAPGTPQLSNGATAEPAPAAPAPIVFQ